MKMEADVVIVGTGVGGLFSALSLSRDQKIIMITKSDLESSDSFLAQGGICMLHDKDDYMVDAIFAVLYRDVGSIGVAEEIVHGYSSAL